MGILQQLITGFIDVFKFWPLLMICFGVFVGITVGALPGLTATMSIAVLTPITFGLTPTLGISLLLGVYVGGIYGGSITAILLRTPGTASSIATTFDGYPLSQKGRSGEALYIALICSVIGGLFSAIVLIFLAPQIAKIALQFGPREIFGLTIFGISIIASVSGDNLIKGLISGIIGLMLSLIGRDLMTGVTRFTFGSLSLTQGMSLIPVLIGVFALSEVFNNIRDEKMNISDSSAQAQIGKLYLPFKEFWKMKRCILISAIIGTFIGIVPGTGGGIASFMAYNFAKSGSKHPEEFGKGALEGVASAETANNATTGGALVPMLTLGIPGDSSTAVLIGALMIHGIQPGPMIFQTDARTVYMLFAALLIANVVLLILGLFGIRIFSKVTKIPIWLLLPSIIVLCVVGSYSVSNSGFDLVVMFVVGVLGYFMQRNGFPGSPLIIGLILGPMNEMALRVALTASKGDWTVFLKSPISLSLLILTVGSLIYPMIKGKIFNRKTDITSFDKSDGGK